MMYKEAPLFNGGEPYMFNQFRVRYPKGSLLTELSAIDHGKYIVRCLVQDEGTTLVTSLAAAETVELAEEKARSRALAILGINAATARGEQETPLVTREVSVLPNPMPKASPAFSSENLSPTPSAWSPDVVTEDIQPLKNGSDVGINPWGNTEVEDTGIRKQEDNATPISTSSHDTVLPETSVEFPFSGLSSEVSPPSQPLDVPAAVTNDTSKSKREKTSKRGAKTPRVVEEMNFGISDEVSATEVETSFPSPDEVETPLWIAEQAPPAPMDDEPVPLSSPSEPEPDKSQKPATPTPVDFSEIIARTNVELKRLGWTNQQGRDYLVQTYGKRSRQLLTDEELLDFLNHLESEPTPEG